MQHACHSPGCFAVSHGHRWRWRAEALPRSSKVSSSVDALNYANANQLICVDADQPRQRTTSNGLGTQLACLLIRRRVTGRRRPNARRRWRRRGPNSARSWAVPRDRHAKRFHWSHWPPGSRDHLAGLCVGAPPIATREMGGAPIHVLRGGGCCERFGHLPPTKQTKRRKPNLVIWITEPSNDSK